MQVTLNAMPASLAEFRNLSLRTPEEVVAGFLGIRIPAAQDP